MKSEFTRRPLLIRPGGPKDHRPRASILDVGAQDAHDFHQVIRGMPTDIGIREVIDACMHQDSVGVPSVDFVKCPAKSIRQSGTGDGELEHPMVCLVRANVTLSQ